ncbi:HNH endonuclease [Candidatus Woesearchaeota archaeon]|nr:HNH endonuclease [Candidatus Woesearchaeota archaeon]
MARDEKGTFKKGHIPKGYVIHHINGNKLDNRMENLSLMINSEHRSLHNKMELKNNPKRNFFGKNQYLRGEEN